VILFTVDTLRADALGSYGNTRGLTPHIDALAAKSLRFEDPYSQASHTHAAMSSMLTGLYPHHTGVLGMSGALAEGVEGVAVAVREAGIATGSFAASHCAPGKVENTVWHDGWDTVFCIRDEATEHWDWDRTAVAKAMEWISRQEGPYFCWIHLIDPHGEHIPPPRHWKSGEEYWDEKEQQLLFQATYSNAGQYPKPEELELLLRLYDAEVRGVDDQVGRLMKFLDERVDDTGVALIFSADHGEELFESSPRYGHGRILTEAVLRVPLLVMAPGIAPGVSKDPVETLQVAPTIYELFNLPVPRSLDGASLLAARPSKGYAVSYYGSTVTIRRGDLRGWLTSEALPADPMAKLYASEDTSPVPWFAARSAAARFEKGTHPYMPTYISGEGLDAPELKQGLWGPLQEHLAQLKPVAELRELSLEGDLLQELKDMGYVGD
jgi:arylsulfatase A-like enzyme